MNGNKEIQFWHEPNWTLCKIGIMRNQYNNNIICSETSNVVGLTC